jgi:hypothetical protein
VIEPSPAWPAYSVDRCLQDAATTRLLSGTGTPPGVVTAEAKDGWILLSGAVDYRFQQQAAALQLAGLEDVRGVRNGVTIRPHTGRTIWDDFLGRDPACRAIGGCLTLSDLTLAPRAAEADFVSFPTRTAA